MQVGRPRTRRSSLAIAAGLAFVALAGGCSSSSEAAGNRTEVVAAFYPLAFAVGQVGGSLVHVDDLTPPGVEPHDLELSTGEVRLVSGADLVIYVGHGFQPAVEDAVSEADPADVLDALGGQSLMTPSEEASHGITETIGEPEGESIDPHVWLDPTRMITMARTIEKRLASIDRAHADSYEQGAETFVARLERLDRDFARGLAHCRSREIVTSHAAFGYLATRYGLTQVSVSGLDPESEPAPGRLAGIARLVEERGITTIFSEELAPPEIAETLGRESNAEVEVLSPLESAPTTGDYFSVMRANLDRLREALDCA